MANLQGISILERLEQPEERQQMIEECLGLETEMYYIRAATLDAWSSISDQEPIFDFDGDIRCQIGKMEMDALTIKKYSEHTEDYIRIQEWKNPFYRYYGITYVDDMADEMTILHPYFQTVLNRRASVISMRKWDDPENAEKKIRIITNANKIIEEWLRGSPDFFQENSRTMEYYRQIEKDWFRV